MQLEVAATEFECQGLELDWTCVCWGGDFLFDPEAGAWRHRTFRGRNWRDVRKQRTQAYITNKYRVLLTRAREGMVIWLPPNDARAAGADGLDFDATAEALHGAGSPWL